MLTCYECECDGADVEIRDSLDGEVLCDDCFECTLDNIRCAQHDRMHYGDGGIDFADPGGNSALRAATHDNPRNLPCPTCGGEDLLTPADRARGYQCDRCSDRCERGW